MLNLVNARRVTVRYIHRILVPAYDLKLGELFNIYLLAYQVCGVFRLGMAEKRILPQTKIRRR